VTRAAPKANYYGLILAGGRGTRFWPKSRRRFAKQVMTILGDRSLIQSTLDRLRPLIAPDRMWVITNDYLRDEIARQLPEIPKRQILAEPAQRNTAPAIGLVAHILNSLDPGTVMGVFPSDHVVSKPERYRQLLRPAFRAAEKGAIAVLGIQPRWAETGYGYIEFPDETRPGALAAVPVRSFREKPEVAKAQEYIDAGRFYWNAGMFFFRPAVLLAELRRHLPRTATLLSSLPKFSSRRFPSAMAGVFPKCENISIDFAVLEKAANVSGVACDDIGWNDVGSWNAVYELQARDGSANALPPGAIALASEGNFVDVRGKTIALLGVNDLVIVDTPDALLIAGRKRAQEVGTLVKMLEKAGRDDLL
jgi:mannose-1-phosphate guanylyltransferase